MYKDVLNFINSKLLFIDINLASEKDTQLSNCFSGVPLNTFMDATEAEIWNIIKLSPVKSCELDPLPTCTVH